MLNTINLTYDLSNGCVTQWIMRYPYTSKVLGSTLQCMCTLGGRKLLVYVCIIVAAIFDLRHRKFREGRNSNMAISREKSKEGFAQLVSAQSSLREIPGSIVTHLKSFFRLLSFPCKT